MGSSLYVSFHCVSFLWSCSEVRDMKDFEGIFQGQCGLAMFEGVESGLTHARQDSQLLLIQSLSLASLPRFLCKCCPIQEKVPSHRSLICLTS